MDNLANQFFEISSLLRQELRAGITGPVSIIEMRGLEFFVANPGAQQKDLAAYWGITNASTSAFISKMEKLKFIEKSRDPNDRRASVLKITPQGSRVIAEMRKSAAEISIPFFANLTQSEQAQLSKILERLRPHKK